MCILLVFDGSTPHILCTYDVIVTQKCLKRKALTVISLFQRKDARICRGAEHLLVLG